MPAQNGVIFSFSGRFCDAAITCENNFLCEQCLIVLKPVHTMSQSQRLKFYLSKYSISNNFSNLASGHIGVGGLVG